MVGVGVWVLIVDTGRVQGGLFSVDACGGTMMELCRDVPFGFDSSILNPEIQT